MFTHPFGSAVTSVRRGWRVLATVVALSCAVLSATAQEAPPLIRVTILGSGSPVPSSTRFSQSTLVEAGGQRLLFDLGRGVTIRLAQLGIPFRDITASFITHFHSDHLVGLPDLWLTGWLPTPWASRTQPFVIYGPVGTTEMTGHLSKAFARDESIREADELLPKAGIAFDAHDIGPGLVYDQSGLTVTAFEAHHGDLITPNYGYTIAYRGKKVVISSDTTYDERVARQAAGADLLLHEVADIDPGLLKAFPRFKEIAAHHTSPEEAGRIFSLAKPKLAAFTHIIVAKAKAPLDVPPTEVLARTRSTYEGPLVLGEDLMRFDIGDDVTVWNARHQPVQAHADPQAKP